MGGSAGGSGAGSAGESGAGQPGPSVVATPLAVPAVAPPRLVRSVPYEGPRPTLLQLLREYQYGTPLVILDPSARPEDWRLAHPDPAVVSGYAGQMSVPAGGVVDLHLRSTQGPLRLDVFRLGLDDARHLETVPAVAAGDPPLARPDPRTGLVDEAWPVSLRLPIPADWPSGAYLVKMTTGAGVDGYVLFVVRTTTPAPFLVMLPTMTYAAYDEFGGADLYGWRGGPRRLATEVGFDRPFSHAYGGSHFFRLDFPLIVWLEDHGYQPAYATDVDVSNDPALVTGARLVLVSGHAEYWTTALRDAFDQARTAGVSLFNAGADEAAWQVRLGPDAAGVPDRVVVCWKSLRADPIAATRPELATGRFSELPSPRPSRQLFGEDYGGIVAGLASMTMGPDIARFAPDTGLRPGQALPGLIGDEIDDASTEPGALVLAATPVRPRDRAASVAGASAWVTPSGAHVFDAGTFDWSWGLDPRYAAALPGFPAESWSRLMADLLAWGGVRPSG